MSAFISGIVGAFAEAWQEVRIHRGRVLLSLVGVAVAVCALTASVAMAGLAEQSTLEQAESSGGRAATLALNLSPTDATPTGWDKPTKAWLDVLERYGISYASRMVWSNTRVQFVEGEQDVQLLIVDQPFAQMHRLRIVEGSWFTVDDSDRLAPAIVINEPFWQQIGSPDLATHPIVTIPGVGSVKAVVVGVYATPAWEEMPGMYMLDASFKASVDPAVVVSNYYPQFQMWVPPMLAKELQQRIEAELTQSLGTPVTVDRMDWGAYNDDPTAIFRILTLAIGGIILLLGALSLLNIALVTVRQRIREIGIRRSFGATSGRVFFSVMMESVVGTVAAGIVGVIFAVLIVESPLVTDFVGQGLVSDIPPFPVSAAIFGMIVAVSVGALAGLIPAIIAVRVKVIDAIRY